MSLIGKESENAMMNVVISGADRNIGLEITKQFLNRGWRVFAGRFLMELPLLDELKETYPDALHIVPMDVSNEESVLAAAEQVAGEAGQVDMLVHNAAGFGSNGRSKTGRTDYSTFAAPYNINALGAMRLVNCFLPLMKDSGLKRLCFVSSEAGVVSVAHRAEVSSYCMSKTALNIALRLMFNQLQPMGYTFRLYHPGWVRSARIEKASDLQPGFEAEGKRTGKFWPWEAAASAAEQFIEDRDWEDRLVLIDNEGAAWPF